MAAPPSSSAAPSSSSSSASSTPLPLPASAAGPSPKILLAKPPGSGTAGSKFARDDDPSTAAAALRARAPPLGSLNLLASDAWELHPDRALPFLTENTDFTVVGVIGPPGAGKSAIMNELYGFDGSSPGMLPPFAMQSDEARAMTRHCTTGIEIRVSSERLILLDAQPIFSPSILVEMMKPDGSSSVPVLNGESLSADLAHELMSIQLGVFLASVCHILLVVSEGIHDTSMWHLLLTVDMLKHNIPDPSSLTPGHTQSMNIGSDKEWNDNFTAAGEEFLAIPVFVHTKLRERDLSLPNVKLLKKALLQYFGSSSFCRNLTRTKIDPSEYQQQETSDPKSTGPDLMLLPVRVQDERPQYESYASVLGKLRDQILSMNWCSFPKPVSERDWLRNSAKIWEMVKKSPIITEYCRSLQSSGLFRK